MDVPEPVLTISIFCWHSVVIHRWVGRWGGRHRDTETKGTQRNREGHKDTKAETQSWQKRPATGTKKQSKGQKERGQGQSTPEKNHRVSRGGGGRKGGRDREEEETCSSGDKCRCSDGDGQRNVDMKWACQRS